MVSIYNILINSRRNFFFLFFSLSLFSRFLNFFWYFFYGRGAWKFCCRFRLMLDTNWSWKCFIQSYSLKLKSWGAREPLIALSQVFGGEIPYKVCEFYAQISRKSSRNALFTLSIAYSLIFSSRHSLRADFRFNFYSDSVVAGKNIISRQLHNSAGRKKIILQRRYLVHNFLETFATLWILFKTLKLAKIIGLKLSDFFSSLYWWIFKTIFLYHSSEDSS